MRNEFALPEPAAPPPLPPRDLPPAPPAPPARRPGDKAEAIEMLREDVLAAFAYNTPIVV